jgi:hypothetical protein
MLLHIVYVLELLYYHRSGLHRLYRLFTVPVMSGHSGMSGR